ncbi:putative calcium-binding protein CML31 [Vitis vinifera]|uniref:Putative calcium-binding protein CML31 n=1 Tax=Vitis vinifera TaxID=29760 RepID=A0A438FS47_VITVI|nr:putative calcium-binding protein CML31 [Vitis vinifera]
MSRQIEGRKRPKRPTSFLWRLSVLTVVDVILSQFNPGSFSLSSPKKSINYVRCPDTVINAFFFSSSTSKLPVPIFYASHKAIYGLTNCYSQHSKNPSSCASTLRGDDREELLMEEAQEVVESMDSDGDGLEEFVGWMKREGEERKMEELREAFRMYEMEGSGCITPKSLKRMLSRLGESRSVEECSVMIREFDVNGDGVLSFDEFKLMMF